MKSLARFIVLISILIGMASVLAQEDVLTLHINGAQRHQRPPVAFPHAQHAAQIDCIHCHHGYDAEGRNQGSIGEPCSTCHGGGGPQAAVLPLVRAFHLQCKTCHAAGRRAQRHGGPVLCGECHRRR